MGQKLLFVSKYNTHEYTLWAECTVCECQTWWRVKEWVDFKRLIRTECTYCDATNMLVMVSRPPGLRGVIWWKNHVVRVNDVEDGRLSCPLACFSAAAWRDIYAVQQDTQSFLWLDFYSSHMLARHVSDLTGPSSGAFVYKLYVQIWYVVIRYYWTRPAITKL